jgi:hypothetical protein
MTAAVVLMGFALLCTLGVVGYLFVALDKVNAAAHANKLRLDDHARRLVVVERDAGIVDESFMQTWRRMDRKGG